MTLPDGCRAHGIPAYVDDAGTVHIATGARCAGPVRLGHPVPATPLVMPPGLVRAFDRYLDSCAAMEPPSRQMDAWGRVMAAVHEALRDRIKERRT